MSNQAQTRSEVDRLLRTPVDHFIGGEYVAPAGGAYYETTNPATGSCWTKQAGPTRTMTSSGCRPSSRAR